MPRSLPAVKLPPPDAAALAKHPALALLDEAFHRLRLAPLSLLGVYYLGTLPFLLALLYFWADQSRSPDAAERALGGAALVAVLFVGMKVAHAVFAARLGARLRGGSPPAWTWGRLGRLALVQATLQPPGLFVLGLPTLLLMLLTDENSSAGHISFIVLLALLLSLPFAWLYAFYQNVTVFGDGTSAATRPVFRRAWRGALHRPRQNHAGLSLLSLLGFFVTLNLVLVVVGVPMLLKVCTGEENLFTRNLTHLFSTTFFMVLSCLVYLALDPLVKAFYVLRCFYEDSRHTGEDLLSDLAALPPPAASAAAPAPATVEREPVPATSIPVRRPAAAASVLLLAIALGGLLPWRALAAADAPPPPATAPVTAGLGAATPPAARTVSSSELGQSIEEVLAKRKFAWRVPRAEGKPTEATGPLDSFFKKINQWLGRVWKSVSGWFSALGDWLKKWWKPKHDEPDPAPGHSSGAGWLGFLLSKPVLVTLAALLTGVILFLFWRQWQGRQAVVVVGKAVTADPVPVPDLTDDTVLATQLPEDEWLRLADGLLARGERRLALRALYLSGLSSLAARGLLAIARHKSNRDYLQELRRRGRIEPALQEAFGRNVARFERVWYGAHAADDALLSEFQADRERVLG